MKGSHPELKTCRISPLEMPTTFPSRELSVSRGPAFRAESLSSLAGAAGGEIFSAVIASIWANPLPPVLLHLSQKIWKPSGPRTSSMASSPSAERRRRYPWARKVNEASRSKMRKGMPERSRDRASKREQMPAPAMRIGFSVFDVMVRDVAYQPWEMWY